MIDENAIRVRYTAIKDQLDERGRRLFVAAEKLAAGYGGTAAVSRATGVARSTIVRGAKDLLAAPSATVRVRREGAGRPSSSKADPTVLEDLRGLVEPATMGDPVRPLLWVSNSPRARMRAFGSPKLAATSEVQGAALQPKASNRQIAKTLNVDEGTIRKDLAENSARPSGVTAIYQTLCSFRWKYV
jgi:hypothetical protein